MKGQVLHRERAHLKVPDWSLVWNELLTKKLPMFLSRLNEISGGCEKIVPVSESFWSNLKFLRMIDLTACIVRVKCGSDWNAVSVFSQCALQAKTWRCVGMWQTHRRGHTEGLKARQWFWGTSPCSGSVNKKGHLQPWKTSYLMNPYSATAMPEEFQLHWKPWLAWF